MATRIAPADRPAGDAVVAGEHAGLRFETIPLRYDQARWWTRFSRAWPPGSAAMASYGDRIQRGPDFSQRRHGWVADRVRTLGKRVLAAPEPGSVSRVVGR